PFISGPLDAGNYYFVAGYSSDGSTYAESQSDSEPFSIPQASPSILTTASPAITLDDSGAPTISDTITMSGAYNPTGTLVVTCSVPSGTSPTSTELSGHCLFAVISTFPSMAAPAGACNCSASYVGDGNSSTSTDAGGAREPFVVPPASPSILTTASDPIT